MNGQLTFEEFQSFVNRVANQGMKIPDKIISPKSHDKLMEIRKIKPNFDFYTEWEIWWMAAELGI